MQASAEPAEAGDKAPEEASTAGDSDMVSTLKKSKEAAAERASGEEVLSFFWLECSSDLACGHSRR